MQYKKTEDVIRTYRRQVVGGVGGVGKSTGIATTSKRPLILDFDNRWPTEFVDKGDFPLFDLTFPGTKSILLDILAQPSLSQDNMVFDTVTKLLSVIEDHALANDCNGSREKYNAYGHGVKFLRQYFKEILDLVDQIQAKHKITVTFICHSKTADFKSINSESYKKSVLDIPDGIAELLKQWADYVGYAWFETPVDILKKVAKGDSVRYISFTENPSYEAKNSAKFVLPAKIPFDKEGTWAKVVFGETQGLLQELDNLVEQFSEPRRTAILDLIEKGNVRSSSPEKLAGFIERGKQELAKGSK